jgi:hypothetical protein
MPAPVAGIHAFAFAPHQQGVDGRDKPGHDSSVRGTLTASRPGPLPRLRGRDGERETRSATIPPPRPPLRSGDPPPQAGEGDETGQYHV